jgi:hypothetical protein
MRCTTTYLLRRADGRAPLLKIRQCKKTIGISSDRGNGVYTVKLPAINQRSGAWPFKARTPKASRHDGHAIRPTGHAPTNFKIDKDDFKTDQDMTDSQKSILSYYESRQCSSQWRGFLGVLAEEFEGQLGVPELRELMRRIGERFARRAALRACDTLQDLELAINAIWAAQDWGWVQVLDGADYLAIRHYCSPLRAAFGAESASWASAYLEGVYQQWFNALGVNASLQLRVREALQADADGALEFRLAR